MNLLNRDIQELLTRARGAGCVDQVKKMIEGAAFSTWGPRFKRKVERFIRGYEEDRHPTGIIHKKGTVEPREPFLPWTERKKHEVD